MINDAIEFSKKCEDGKKHANYIHQAPELLHPIVPPWPLDEWGIDVIGPIHLPSSRGHRFILPIIDYFSKWEEAVSLIEVKTANLIDFMHLNIIYRFGIPQKIIHDNGPQFRDHRFQKFCDKNRICSYVSTTYNPVAKGLAEAFNKTTCKILKKMVAKNKREWRDKLSKAL